MMTDQQREGLKEDFRSLLSSASFHYADDSTKEWGRAEKLQNEAKELRKFAEGEDPTIHEELNQIASTMLCSA